jgi:hypothetical protein
MSLDFMDTASGPSAGPLPGRPAIPSGAEPAQTGSGGACPAGEGQDPRVLRGRQGRQTYTSDEGLS